MEEKAALFTTVIGDCIFRCVDDGKVEVVKEVDPHIRSARTMLVGTFEYKPKHSRSDEAYLGEFQKECAWWHMSH